MSLIEKKKNIDRRTFLRIAGWGSFILTLGTSLAALIRFMFPRVLREPPPVFSIGFPDDFSGKGEADKNGVCRVYEKWKEEKSVWIVREKDRMYAVHSRCTHLGCTPTWYADEGVFKCPCHGSQFSSNGTNFAGPATRPLDRFHIFIGDDGTIRIDKSRIYKFEECERPGAYLKI